MMLSTTDAVLSRREDGREVASKLSGREASLVRRVRGGLSKIGARGF